MLSFIQEKYKFQAFVFQKEITKEELDVEAICEKFCLQHKIIFHALWGSTLYHRDDLPYTVKWYLVQKLTWIKFTAQF